MLALRANQPRRWPVEVQLGRAELAVLGEGNPVGFFDGGCDVVDQGGDLSVFLNAEGGRGCGDGGLADWRLRAVLCKELGGLLRW